MIDSGNTAFMIICTGLVFFMTVGLAFFYGGFVRRKNVLNTMMSSVSLIGLSAVMWVFVGYSLSFGGNTGGVIGSFKWAFLNGVGLDAVNYGEGTGIPHLLFAAFQMMFAIITPAIITGAIAGRMKFKALFIFVAAWSLVVYYPMAHMVWGEGGFLAEIGSVDFAGGNVVHIASGVSALVLSIFLGARRDHKIGEHRPHNIPFIVLGAGLLWFGWFGFNGGSALAADGLAVHAFMTTAISSSIAMLSWMLVEVIMQKKVTIVGAVTGGVVGLVAITPGAGFVPIWSSIIIGALVSPICYFAVAVIKKKFGYDDTLDAFGCHGVGGIWGGLATGIFGRTSINSVARWDGLAFGDYRLFLAQAVSIIITIVFSIIGTCLCVYIVRIFTKLRVDNRDEKIGLDISEHGESAYPAFNGID